MSSGSASLNSEPKRELVFVDETVRDYEQLIADLQGNNDNRTIEVVMLDSDRNGIEQVSETLSDRSDLSAVHFITHGADGQINLGDTSLNSTTLQQNRDAVAGWGNALTETGDILFYGCNITAGSAGQSLLDGIAEFTGADVAASNDTTGHENLGGDWELETNDGQIETALAPSAAFQEHWNGLLATYTVTSTADSGAGTLRQAILNANANGGPDTISFAIAGTGTHTIAPTSALPTITGQVTIDGTTDDSFAANGNRPAIILAGTNAGIGVDGLVLTSTADGSKIRGLVVRDWGADGISIQAGSDNNFIVGNYIGRINTDGTAAAAGTQNEGDGVYVLGSNNMIGGATAADRNVISGNDDGVTLDTGATGNIVIGNYIGTDATGSVAVGNTLNAGVWIKGGSNNNRIGGTGANEGNLIANNAGDGVFLQTGAGTGNSVLSNSFYSNGGLGIDLGTNGVTANDAGDGDTGANNLQNFPVLTSANANAAGTTIAGTFNSNANTTYRIEFFGNRPAVADASNGEGERSLGAITVTTDGSGNATINTTLANIWVNSGDRVTATATVDLGGGNYGSTSEFAANVTATSTGIIVVDTTSDVSDGTTTSITNLGNARGADGRISLREAIAAANATANGGTPDKIVFNIPLTDANHVYYSNNAVAGTFSAPVATALADSAITDFDADYLAGTARSWYRLALSGTDLNVSQAVIIDGSTQAGYDPAKGPIIELNAAGISSGDPNGLTLTTGGSTVRGLVINRAGDDAIEIDVGAGGSTIVGNYLGTDVSGLNTTYGNGYGITVKPDGNVIGGLTPADRNVIGGNSTLASLSFGIGFWQDSDNNVVQGNYIGVGADGTTAMGNRQGITFQGTPDNNLIGGTAAGAGNIIANNSMNGIDVIAGTGNAFVGNAIHSNTLLGINLGTAGVTANDANDADTGANNLQNFPVLTSATTTGAQVTITGTLKSIANTQFRIEFFANTAQDGSGYGEGKRYLGFANVTTDGSGNATISTTLTATVAVGEFISATATKSNAGFTVFTDTSEFARNVAAVSSTQATITVDTISDASDGDTTSLSTLLANKGADGYISLREAIIAANNTANGASADRIVFDIAGAGPHTIAVGAGGLPTITQAVVIDGSTEPDYTSNVPVVRVDGASAGADV